MHKRKSGDIASIRMLNAEQAQNYCGLGRNAFRAWAEQIGAVRRFGRLVRYDKNIIDAALDKGEQPTG